MVPGSSALFMKVVPAGLVASGWREEWKRPGEVGRPVMVRGELMEYGSPGEAASGAAVDERSSGCELSLVESVPRSICQ